MKLSDMCILLSFMFIVVTIIFSINYIYEIRMQNIKYSYSDKIELALEGALLNSNDDLSIDDTNKIAVEKFTTANFNKEKVINEFLRLLDLNFKGYYKENFYMSKCVPVILFIEDDGVTVNIHKDNKRIMLSKVPFKIKLNEKCYTFKLSDIHNSYKTFEDENLESQMCKTENYKTNEDKNIGKKVIIDTIKRQFTSLGFDVNIPYDDTMLFNSITSKSVIAIVKGLPFMKNECIIKTKGKKETSKGKYIIVEEKYYKKISLENIYKLKKEEYKEILKIYDTMNEAALDNYLPEIL